MKTKSLSEKVYAAILKGFPRYYRETFGEDMLCAFRDMSQEDNALVVWYTVLKELPASLTREYISVLKGSEREKHIRILGIAIILATMLVLLLTLQPDNHDGMFHLMPSSILFFLFGAGGYAASHKTKRLQSGAIGGAVTAVISVVPTSVLFIIMDNQVLPVAGRIIFLLPVALAGAFCGTVGAGVRKLRRVK